MKFRCGIQNSWREDALNRVAGKLQAGSVCSPELKLPGKYETIWDRINWPISSVDSFFSYDFRAAVCSRCADRGGERLAIAENSFASDCLHGIRAHGSHAFQPAR